MSDTRISEKGRLIHGQVTVGWRQHLRYQALCVVDDLTPADPALRDVLRLATPPGVDLYIHTRMVILCPGNLDQENDRHRFLVSKGFEWSPFEEPGKGVKRKYWRKG